MVINHLLNGMVLQVGGGVAGAGGEFGGGLFPETWVRSLFFVLCMEVAKNAFKIRWAGYQKLSVLGGWILFKPFDCFEDGQNYQNTTVITVTTNLLPKKISLKSSVDSTIQ